MGDTLGEADLRAGIARGGTIENVVVVAYRDAGGGVEHVPYILPSWRRGYVAIALFRGPGVRAWRDLDRLRRFLRDDLGFALPISLYDEGCPKLARFKSLLPPGATSSRVRTADTPQPDEDDTETPPPG